MSEKKEPEENEVPYYDPEKFYYPPQRTEKWTRGHCFTTTFYVVCSCYLCFLAISPYFIPYETDEKTGERTWIQCEPDYFTFWNYQDKECKRFAYQYEDLTTEQSKGITNGACVSGWNSTAEQFDVKAKCVMKKNATGGLVLDYVDTWTYKSTDKTCKGKNTERYGGANIKVYHHKCVPHPWIQDYYVMFKYEEPPKPWVSILALALCSQICAACCFYCILCKEPRRTTSEDDRQEADFYRRRQAYFKWQEQYDPRPKKPKTQQQNLPV